ncbi:N-acetylglucosamine-6-phosphate deacetylase OS=Streptomyces glaucescens OX=1907 GN=SGLAU_15460 PE=3 SV=1 [Streptomyces glaucescens]
MDAAGFGDGRYMLGPLEVEVADGVARLVEGGTIAGSTWPWTVPSSGR